MSVWREDPTTGSWVIVAPARRARPHDAEAEPGPGSGSVCPLCPGHEDQTPPELLRLPAENGDGWAVRVVANKFAALSPTADSTAEHREAGLLRERDGFGYHELIVDGPHHDQRPGEMGTRALARVLDVYHARYAALRRDPRVAYILVFKNCGARASASLVHPHSQLVATPFAPLALERRYIRARAHFERTGRCLYCDLLAAELQAARRIVWETERFVVVCPFASGTPFETWILPKRHQPSFGSTSAADRMELAAVLRPTLRALDVVLDRPDFNYVLHTAPVAEEDRPFYLWHVQVLPRVATLAGFELGSGIRINAVEPEHAATQLRQQMRDLARSAVAGA
jgi:UDPglucose--hexose-1-phosphate uridylyltransferase